MFEHLIINEKMGINGKPYIELVAPDGFVFYDKFDETGEFVYLKYIATPITDIDVLRDRFVVQKE